MKKLIFTFLLLNVCVITNGQKKRVDVYLHDPNWYMEYKLADFKTDPKVQADYARLVEQYKAAKQQQEINELREQINKLKVGDKKIESYERAQPDPIYDAKIKSKTIEISLYDKTGHAKAYVPVSGLATVYLWDGSPVAYFSRVSNGEEIWHIYNFDGKHIGWTIPGTGALFDNDGYIVCGVRNSLDIATYAERPKPVRKSDKKARRNKGAKESAPARPLFKRMLWSDISLEDFFYY